MSTTTLAERAARGITDEQFGELESKYEDVFRLRSGADDNRYYEVVFRRPTRTEYKLFRAASLNAAKRSEAQEDLGRKTIVATFYKGAATGLAPEFDYAKARMVLDDMLERFCGVCDSEAFSGGMEKLVHNAREVDAK